MSRDVNGGRTFPFRNQYGWFSAFKLHKHRAGVYSASSVRRQGRRRERNYCYFKTSRCSKGVRDAYGEWTAARDDSLDYRAEQAVRSGPVTLTSLLFWKREIVLLVFPLCFVCSLLCMFPDLSTTCRSRYERRYDELFGCTGCVNCCTRRGAFTISIFRR